MTTKEIAKVLFDRRKERKITLREWEKLSGVRENYLTKLEHGKFSPSISTLEKICDPIGLEIIVKEKGSH